MRGYFFCREIGPQNHWIGWGGGGGGRAHLLSFPPLVDPNIANMFCRRMLTKRVEQHGQYGDNGS